LSKYICKEYNDKLKTSTKTTIINSLRNQQKKKENKFKDLEKNVKNKYNILTPESKTEISKTILTNSKEESSKKIIQLYIDNIIKK
jgi:hypothetical protein